MTKSVGSNLAGNWKLVSSRHSDAGVDDSGGNLSFHADSPEDKRKSYSILENWNDTELIISHFYLWLVAVDTKEEDISPDLNLENEDLFQNQSGLVTWNKR